MLVLYLSLASSCRFHRIGLVLLTLHYFCDFVTHAFQLAEIFDKNDKLSPGAYL